MESYDTQGILKIISDGRISKSRAKKQLGLSKLFWNKNSFFSKNNFWFSMLFNTDDPLDFLYEIKWKLNFENYTGVNP